MGDAAKKLFHEAIKLPQEERRDFALRLLASVGDEHGGSPPRVSGGATASWQTIASLQGVVQLGGNAVDDCNELYDG